MLEGIAPFFIVRDLGRSVGFYRDRLGFEVVYEAPPDRPFFAIVQRDGARLFRKEIGPEVEPRPNATIHEWAPWDAFVSVADPDAWAAACGATITTRDDGLRGFEIEDPDGHVLFFGRPAP